ncbi:hypothetical protein [Nonomuraea sp. NPDC048826]|uniref:serine/threonine protein kinase n=1 Tax=Nonomuraea sp. NPDC048826 TaxID=3364347 RepID=UPI00372228F0
MKMHPLRPGDPEKLGAYVLSGRLADGPRGAAFLGKEESDEAPLRVVKLLPATPDSGEDEIARITGVERVSSAYVARTLEAGRHGDHLYVVREHVEGRSLAEVLAEDGPLEADALERVAVGVLTALTAIHLAGITHRGLTPHNVIIGPDGPRVTDIDLGEPAGETGYRAPEQIRGLAYGPYADVFAWATTVVFAATGQPPFGHDEAAVLDGEPEPGDLDEPLRRVVMSALSKDVAQRPTTYMALLQLLGDKRGGVVARKGSPEGAPLQGVPVPGIPMQGAPGQGVPGQGVPGQGVPFDGVPMQGVPVDGPPPQAWGPPPVPPQPTAPLPPQAGGPVPPQGASDGPVPPQGALPGGSPQGALPAEQEPMRGVTVPPAAPGWAPPPEQPRQAPVAGQTVPSRAPRKFPAGLVAAVGALALLSGVGLWGANQYASTQRFEPVAAAGDQAEERGSGRDKVENGVAQGEKNPAPQDDQPQGSQPEVTVPWATPSSGEANDVGPMVLPTDWTSQPPATPELSTVPTPVLVTTQPVPQQATAQPTVTVTEDRNGKPTARPTRARDRVEPTGSPAPTATVTATPTPTPTPSPTVTVTVTPTPTPTVTETVAPSAVPTVAPTAVPTQKPTQKPTAKPTATAKPGVNPYSAVQVCGEGFYVQRSQAFKGGETFQLYNASAGVNCVVTLKRVNIGKATEVSATLEVQGGETKTALGNYEYYAGPVKAPAKGKCVRFAGSVEDEGVRTGWANCG